MPLNGFIETNKSLFSCTLTTTVLCFFSVKVEFDRTVTKLIDPNAPCAQLSLLKRASS